MKTKIICIILASVLFGTFASSAGEDLYPVTASDKAFFKQVQKAVLVQNWEWVSAAVSYPIDVYLNKGTLRIATKEELKKRMPLIFGEHLKQVIRAQTEASLFKNWQGVMIGQGEIWFSEVEEKNQKDGRLTKTQRIIAINRITDKGSSKK
jgi:hypothetical protein